MVVSALNRCLREDSGDKDVRSEKENDFLLGKYYLNCHCTYYDHKYNNMNNYLYQK